MNKLSKNKIWFNLEKIISIVTVSAIIITTIAMLTSCTSTMKTTYKPNYEYLKSHKNQYEWTCNKF